MEGGKDLISISYTDWFLSWPGWESGLGQSEGRQVWTSHRRDVMRWKMCHEKWMSSFNVRVWILRWVQCSECTTENLPQGETLSPNLKSFWDGLNQNYLLSDVSAKDQALKWSFFCLEIWFVLFSIWMHMNPVKSVGTGDEACLGSTCTEVLTGVSEQTDADTPHSHCCRRTKDTQLFTYSLIWHQNETRWKTERRKMIKAVFTVNRQMCNNIRGEVDTLEPKLKLKNILITYSLNNTLTALCWF